MIGAKTHFIRLGGCDYRCTKCDSLHAVLPEAVKKNAQWLQPESIVEELLVLGGPSKTPWVTLSGGNPAMWDCSKLVGLLKFAGYKVALETQGSIWQPWIEDCDHITVSPKGPGMGERFDPAIFRSFMNNLGPDDFPEYLTVKIVVFDQRDFEFAKQVGHILDYELFFEGGKYLSLGNDFPPIVNPDGTLDTGPIISHRNGGQLATDLPTWLLQGYRVLLEDYLQEEALSTWKFLPQLHVLLYANQAKV